MEQSTQSPSATQEPSQSPQSPARIGSSELQRRLDRALAIAGNTHTLADIKDALDKLHVSGMTVTEVRGHGRQKGHTAVYRGKEYNVSLLPKMQIEVVVAESLLDSVVQAVIAAARTGEIGDGRVFVLPVEQNYHIRTGERDA